MKALSLIRNLKALVDKVPQQSEARGPLEDGVESLISEYLDSLSITTVRFIATLPEFLQRSALDKLLYSIDTSVEFDNDESNPMYICVDSWALALDGFDDDVIRQILRDERILDVVDLMAEIEKRDAFVFGDPPAGPVQ